jgi:hypothetical protein
MGEAKRKRASSFRELTSEEIQASAGQPVNMWLFNYPPPPGVKIVLPASFEEVQREPVKWARLIALDCIVSIEGKGEAWPCVLCGKTFSGTAQLATVAVVDPMRDGGGKTMAAPVCRGCHGGGEETERRVKAAFGLVDLQEGHA